VKEAVATAVMGLAIPLARKDDFARSLQHALLFWQIPAFLLTGLLVFALPKVGHPARSQAEPERTPLRPTP